jgi:hypothetical protein
VLITKIARVLFAYPPAGVGGGAPLLWMIQMSQAWLLLLLTTTPDVRVINQFHKKFPMTKKAMNEGIYINPYPPYPPLPLHFSSSLCADY